MKIKLKSFVQSCDSRECRKNHKSQITDVCDAVTTVHTYNIEKREVVCTECGKKNKLSK